jgi:hypothetical protein
MKTRNTIQLKGKAPFQHYLYSSFFYFGLDSERPKARGAKTHVRGFDLT